MVGIIPRHNISLSLQIQDKMKLPKISIVTPNLNGEIYLEETICSVLDQNYANIEYIIIDGGSVDKSIFIIKKYEKYLNYWESSKDKGQADAILKGFSHATGEMMNWINSDDILAPEALQHIGELSIEFPSINIFAAATENFMGNDFRSNTTKLVSMNIDLESLFFLNKKIIRRHQPGIFFRNKLYNEVGGINPKYFMCMDLDLHMRMLSIGERVIYSSKTVAFFRQHGLSKTQQQSPQNALIAVNEYIEISDRIGKDKNITPNHFRGHFKTLLSILIKSLIIFDLRCSCKTINLIARKIIPNFVTRSIIKLGIK